MLTSQGHRFKELSHKRWWRWLEKIRRFEQRSHFYDLVFSFIWAFLAVLLLRYDGQLRYPQFKAGDVSDKNVRVLQAAEIEDFDSLEEEKDQILAKVAPVYDLDNEAVSQWIEQWKGAIRDMRHAKDLKIEKRIKTLSEKLGFHLNSEEFQILEKLNFSLDLERSIAFSMGPLWDQKIVENKNFPNSQIELVDIRTSKSLNLRASEYSTLFSLEDARNLVGKAARTDARGGGDKIRLPWSTWSASNKLGVFQMQSKLVRANVTLNRKESEVRKTQALRDLHPKILKLERGYLLVKQGEKVSNRAADILTALNKEQKSSQKNHRIPYEAVFAGFSLWLLLLYLRRQYPKLLQNYRDVVVAATFLIVALAALKLVLSFELNIIATYFFALPPHFFLFLIPVAAPAMTLRLLLNYSSIVVIFCVLLGLCTAVMLDGAALFGVYSTLTSLLGAQFLMRCRTRNQLYVAGLKTAILSGCAALTLMGAWEGGFPLPSIWNPPAVETFGSAQLVLWTFIGGCIGGWLSSALTLILTPIIENFVDYTTDLKLLELARMDHPLLKSLVLKAPGTYHHSIIVGSLAEAACEAIGANSLLARVGSYYHDIGKLSRPEYFVENQLQGMSPHEQTTPQLSAKIIIAHVKEGVALAEQYKLGKNLIDFIEQHHGTSLVSYFFNKAKQDAAQPGSKVRPSEVHEEDFRYPGPKPQSKETAVVALADSCEAAARALVDPTPARIEGLVKKIITKAYSEGLLDEAEITHREVQLAQMAFIRTLLGIHHHRIAYPDQEKGLPKGTLSLLKVNDQ